VQPVAQAGDRFPFGERVGTVNEQGDRAGHTSRGCGRLTGDDLAEDLDILPY
jgi:hypothetical protein